MNVGIQDGLIDPKHERAMGQAIWLFLWCIRCQTQRASFVLGGMPLTYREISRRSGFPERKIRRWLTTLRFHNYVTVTYLNFKMLRIDISKQKKWFPKQEKIPFPSHRPQTVNSHRPQTVEGATKNGQSKQSCILRENYKTPLPPAGAGDSSQQFVERYGELICVEMGRHKRLPDLSSLTGSRAAEVASYLSSMGFPSKIVKNE